MGRMVAGLYPRSPESDPRKMAVWFVADDVTLVQTFLRLCRFYHITLIPLVFHKHISVIFLSRNIIISVDGFVKSVTSLSNITRPLSIRAQKLTKNFVILVSRVQKWNNRQSLMFCGNYEKKNASIEGSSTCPPIACYLIFHKFKFNF